MATVYQRLKVPYSAEQMFELVVDIERYPQFVPGWRAVRITNRKGDRRQGWLHVDQVISDKGIRFRFDTDARYTRPTYLRISANGRPFQYFVLRWQFRPLADGGCEVIAHARYRLPRPLPPAQRAAAPSGREVLPPDLQHGRQLVRQPGEEALRRARGRPAKAQAGLTLIPSPPPGRRGSGRGGLHGGYP
jgi:coenzyme Q-binding protein COQ10